MKSIYSFNQIYLKFALLISVANLFVSPQRVQANDNVIKIIHTGFMTPNQDGEYILSDTERLSQLFELNRESDKERSIRPVIYIQNVLDTLGKQLQPAVHDIEFKVQALIHDTEGNQLYGISTNISKECLAHDYSAGYCDKPNTYIEYVRKKVDGGYTVLDFNDSIANGRVYEGLPPNTIVKVVLPIFQPKYDEVSGQLTFSVVAGDLKDGSKTLNESLLKDNETTNQIQILENAPSNLIVEPFERYEVDKNGIPIPNTSLWISEGASLVSGTEISNDPLSLPWPFLPMNDEEYPNYQLKHPTLQMNRMTFSGEDWSKIKGRAAGDIITSHLIPLDSGRTYTFSMSLQRGKSNSWDRGYGDNVLIGPEPRVILNGNPLDAFDPPNAASHIPDSLIVEIYVPNEDSGFKTANIPDKDWRRLERPYLDESNPERVERSMAALTIFGAGGILSPISPNSDSIQLPPTTESAGALKANIYDVGLGEGFKRYFFSIPSSMSNSPYRDNFRLRVRVAATDDQKCDDCIPDDNDDFFVDDLQLMQNDEEVTDLNTFTKIVSWPYALAAGSLATEILIKVPVTNNTTTNAPFYLVQTVIFKEKMENIVSWYQGLLGYVLHNDPVYCRRVTIPQHHGLTTNVWHLPAFNAQEAGEGTYTIISWVDIPGDYEYQSDDLIMMKEISLKFGDVIAYEDGTNDADAADYKPSGSGLTLGGFSEGGLGDSQGYTEGYFHRRYANGAAGGDRSGDIAVSFRLDRQDTIKGYEAYFGRLKSAPDDIKYTIYKDDNGLPGDSVIGSGLYTQALYDYRTNDFRNGEICRVKLEKELLLPKGKYWLSITQLGEAGIELGASADNMGQRTMNVSIETGTGELGLEGNSLNITDMSQERMAYNGNGYNNNQVVYRNGTAKWMEFTPTTGNTAYANSDHTGQSVVDNQTMTLTQGSWMPILRPVLDYKSEATNAVAEMCTEWFTPSRRAAAPLWLPVELVAFNARPLAIGNSISWETASEMNNYGFYVERKNESSTLFSEWEQISFVKGQGTTTDLSEYRYIDSLIEPGATYSYKLRQVDFDGSQSCNETIAITVTSVIELGSENLLGLASPNPFGITSPTTIISFTLLQSIVVRFQIIDMAGKTVKDFGEIAYGAGKHAIQWDGRNNNGLLLPSGNYRYHLITDDESKMGVIQYRK